MSISVRIQAHPSRAHLLSPLLEALSPLTTQVMSHASVPPNPWLGYKNCLKDLPECPFVLVIQDDAMPCRNFAPAVEQIAVANPEHPVCLFLARLPRDVSTRATQALRANRRYVTWIPRSFVPVVAVLWPRAKVEAFKDWADTSPRTSGRYQPRSDDAMVGLWGALTRQEFRATVPSLVEHPDMEPSLIGRRPAWGKDKGRVAQHFAEDGLQYDW